MSTEYFPECFYIGTIFNHSKNPEKWLIIPFSLESIFLIRESSVGVDSGLIETGEPG